MTARNLPTNGAARVRRQAMAEKKFSRMVIMAIDDQDYMLTVMKDMLRQIGVGEIVTANNLERAEEMIRKPAHVLFCAMDMEEMDGVAFVRELRAKDGNPNREIPIIMMTGQPEQKQVMAARDAGATEFLIKPVSVITLEQRLEIVLEHPRPFVNGGGFVGPDRRRRQANGDEVPQRRADDQAD